MTEPQQAKKGKKESQANKENSHKWWLKQAGNTQNAGTKSVEKTRYVKALRAMVKEKGIPSICICGASQKDGKYSVCASNCQFYQNDKEYERALRDILACTQ